MIKCKYNENHNIEKVNSEVGEKVIIEIELLPIESHLFSFELY
jgi:hypothetical protein